MTQKTDYFNIDDFHAALDQKNADELCQMLRGGALYYIEESDSISVLRKLLLVRDMKVMNEASRHINYFPTEMLEEIDLTNFKTREFIGRFLSRYINKFSYDKKDHAETLFAKACICESIDTIRFLMKKGLAENQYPLIISSTEKVRRLLSEVKISALSKDTISTFFLEAALTDFPEDRIYDLLKYNFDILVINSDGLNVVDAFRKGIENYSYPKSKQGTLERQHDEGGLKVLEKIYTPIAASKNH